MNRNRIPQKKPPIAATPGPLSHSRLTMNAMTYMANGKKSSRFPVSVQSTNQRQAGTAFQGNATDSRSRPRRKSPAQQHQPMPDRQRRQEPDRNPTSVMRKAVFSKEGCLWWSACSELVFMRPMYTHRQYVFQPRDAHSCNKVLDNLTTKLRKLFMSPCVQVRQLVVIKPKKVKHCYVHISNRMHAF